MEWTAFIAKKKRTPIKLFFAFRLQCCCSTQEMFSFQARCVLGVLLVRCVSTSSCPCSAGFYCEITAGTCLQCPPNSQSLQGSLQLANCFCPPGYFGRNGTSCFKCSAGKFKELAGNGPCIKCPSAFTSYSGTVDPINCNIAISSLAKMSYNQNKSMATIANRSSGVRELGRRGHGGQRNVNIRGRRSAQATSTLENETDRPCGYGTSCCPGLFFQAPYALISSWNYVILNLADYSVITIDDVYALPIFKFSANGQLLIGVVNFGGDGGGHVYKSTINPFQTTVIAGGTAGSAGGGAADGYGTNAQFDGPSDLAVSNDGNFVLVSDQAEYDGYTRCRLRKVDLSTNLVSTIAGSQCGDRDGIGTEAQFQYFLDSVSISPDDTFALVTGYDRIRKLDLITLEVTTLASGFENYVDKVRISPDGTFAVYFRLYDYKVGMISLEDNSVTTIAGGDQGFADGEASNAEFGYMTELSMSPTGNYVLVMDRGPAMYSNQVRRIDLKDQIVSTVNSGLDYAGLAISGCALCNDGAYCALCNEGAFSNEVGAVSCTLCSGGTFQNDTGKSQCLQCPKGRILTRHLYALVSLHGRGRD